MPPQKPPTRKPAPCATNGPRPPRHWPPPKRPPTAAILTPRLRRPGKPKRWQRRRSSRPPAKGRAGKTWKYAELVHDARRFFMTIRRRDFLKATAAATLSGSLPRLARG